MDTTITTPLSALAWADDPSCCAFACYEDEGCQCSGCKDAERAAFKRQELSRVADLVEGALRTADDDPAVETDY